MFSPIVSARQVAEKKKVKILVFPGFPAEVTAVREIAHVAMVDTGTVNAGGPFKKVVVGITDRPETFQISKNAELLSRSTGELLRMHTDEQIIPQKRWSHVFMNSDDEDDVKALSFGGN